MSIFNGLISIGNVGTLLFVVFTVLLFGYGIGRITIKGIFLRRCRRVHYCTSFRCIVLQH